MKIPTALYRLYDDAGELLYVGISKRPKYRLTDHRRDKKWASEIHSVTIEWHPSLDDALVAEAAAIASERPAYNISPSQVRRRCSDTSWAPGYEPIYGVAEMSHVPGLTTQRIAQLIKKSDFPAPCYELKAAKFWRVSDFEAWAQATGRTLKQWVASPSTT